MNKSEVLIQQTARGAKMMFISIVVTMVGVFTLVVGFLSYAEFANVLASTSILFVGVMAITLSSHFYLKGWNLVDASRYGILKPS